MKVDSFQREIESSIRARSSVTVVQIKISRKHLKVERTYLASPRLAQVYYAVSKTARKLAT
jgi:hypothetical protein